MTRDGPIEIAIGDFPSRLPNSWMEKLLEYPKIEEDNLGVPDLGVPAFQEKPN